MSLTYTNKRVLFQLTQVNEQPILIHKGNRVIGPQTCDLQCVSLKLTWKVPSPSSSFNTQEF